jgi:hypothetical protein
MQSGALTGRAGRSGDANRPDGAGSVDSHGRILRGYRLTQRLGLPKADAIAVGFSGSQKTLMVGLEIAIASQLSILPMITFHAGQLFIDTLIADRLGGAGVKKMPIFRPPNAMVRPVRILTVR